MWSTDSIDFRALTVSAGHTCALACHASLTQCQQTPRLQHLCDPVQIRNATSQLLASKKVLPVCMPEFDLASLMFAIIWSI